ncbi:hypothetical protein BH10PSE17_BH10PSE17_07410 [soil metagenome]
MAGLRSLRLAMAAPAACLLMLYSGCSMPAAVAPQALPAG